MVVSAGLTYHSAVAEPVCITILLGVTASGKSAAALALARAVGAEILSVDSMQVYRRMNIGTAKPSPDELAQVRHHLIDVVEPSEPFSAARFVELAEAAIADMKARGVPSLAVGGTSLYIKALTEGLFDGPTSDPMVRDELRRRSEAIGSAGLHAELARADPASADRIHPNDLRRVVRALEVYRQTGTAISELQRQFGRPRPGYRFTFVGLRRTPRAQSGRINQRVRLMIEQGLVQEVRDLLAEPAGLSIQARQALGYAQIIDHLQGRCPLERAVEQIKILTRRFAKHQRTWFRRFADVHWIDLDSQPQPEPSPDQVARQILDAGWLARR